MLGNAASSIIIAGIVLGIIIVIHELGHFLVAKFFKIKVETFSVGFGPRLIGFRKGDTDYRISAFPLGGYVKMAGETPMDEVKGADYEFLSKPKWQRFLVASAGPAMNVILAVGLIAGLYMHGTDVPEFMLGQAVVNIVDQGSAAERAGIRPGDVIASFDGKTNPNWEEVQNTVLINPGRPLPITVERNGTKIALTVTPDRRGREEAGDVGMYPVIRTVVGSVLPNSPAQRAGVKSGDEIIRVKGQDLRTSGRTLQQTIQKMPEQTFPITVLRGTKEVDLEVSPEWKDGRRMIGIDLQLAGPTVHIKLSPIPALEKSLQSNKENAALIFQIVGRLLRREASLKQLDGPVGIVAVSGQAYQAGFATLLTFMALISLNLGILNILPIPILDGGVILLLVIESLMGRDLSLRMKERIVQASFVFLLMLTVIVIYNDVVKLLPPTQPTP
ncbi:MAG TPA: RIP metalloprotease RseP [Terriglobia bacterium]|nr:RIP metalloprotease RseP [Terriglobia bacterium]